ncbi:MAG: hypothetical protein RLZZ207_366 [Bacteroidota bacterium]
MGTQNGFRRTDFTQFFLYIRSKRMDGEKPPKIKTIKLNRLLKNLKSKTFCLENKSLFRIV